MHSCAKMCPLPFLSFFSHSLGVRGTGVIGSPAAEAAPVPNNPPARVLDNHLCCAHISLLFTAEQTRAALLFALWVKVRLPICLCPPPPLPKLAETHQRNEELSRRVVPPVKTGGEEAEPCATQQESPARTGRRRHYRHAGAGAMLSPCAAHSSLRATPSLVCLLLLYTAVQCGAAAQRAAPLTETSPAAEGTEAHADFLAGKNASAAQPYIDREHSCPALSFSFYVAAAMGMWSRTGRLASCPSTRFSTVLDDIRLSREARTSGGTLLSELWRRARGIREENLFYDNAAEFIALEMEIKRFVRANHTLGMHPPHYGDVLGNVADILRLNLTADLLPPNGNGPLPIIAEGPGMESVDQECERNPICLQRHILNEYRRHANRTLKASPNLIVSDATFARAMAYYQKNLASSIIVRAYDLIPDSSNSFQHDLAGFLRIVQKMWDTAKWEVEREEEDAAAEDGVLALRSANVTDASKGKSVSSSIVRPFLPFIKVTDFTGPPMLNRESSFFIQDPPEPPVRGSGSTRQRPLHRVLPAAIVYHTSPSCTSCEVYDRAFDLLPSLFKGLCSHTHVSMVSCSPLTLFLRTTQMSAFDLIPSMDIYARLVYSREAVLRTADTSGFFFSSGSSDDVGDDDAADGARFYSLKSKYGSYRYGIEREVLPRDQFAPNYVSLRQISDGTNVEEVLTSMFAELVEHGVVQFAFIGKSQLNRILKKNKEVLEKLEQRRREEEANAKNGTDETVTSSPPTPNPEADPEYQKVVTFHDLAAELVSSYIKSHFGNVTPLMDRHEWSRHSVRPFTSSWWLLSWLINVVASLWDCVCFELERPLVPVLFLLVFTAQFLWNRVEQVTYW
ncbi:hypothetical protein, conserved [Leishmania tarentolae]|uniref:Transmembrane protein n=1 Tax=Leishmania tarentolae TaxID=5689 RepID=A0A640KYL9_LEITA|nr:hypothetical protein, conserved [Leishmania tarentolae]